MSPHTFRFWKISSNLRPRVKTCTPLLRVCNHLRVLGNIGLLFWTSAAHMVAPGCGHGHGLTVSFAYVGRRGDLGTCDVCMRSVVEGEVVWACHPCKWWTCNECRSAPVAQDHLRTTALCVARLLEAAEEKLQRLYGRWLKRRLRRRLRTSGKRDSKVANALLLAIIGTGWAAQAHARAARAQAVQAQAHQAAKAEAEAAATEMQWRQR